MADGDYTQYENLKGMEESEFFNLYDLHKNRVEEQLKSQHGK
jgi:hypothetical protein